VLLLLNILNIRNAQYDQHTNQLTGHKQAMNNGCKNLYKHIIWEIYYKNLKKTNLEHGKPFYLKTLGKLNVNLTTVWGKHLKCNFLNWETLYLGTS
jgi:hypothetical protein